MRSQDRGNIPEKFTSPLLHQQAFRMFREQDQLVGFELPIPQSQIIHMYNSLHPLSKPFPFIMQSIHPHPDSTIYEELEASTAAALFASATLLTSPCLPFCIIIYQHNSMTFLFVPFLLSCMGQTKALTFHFANLSSISPLRSAANLCSSFKLRRTTRAATERYLL